MGAAIHHRFDRNSAAVGEAAVLVDEQNQVGA
jgi:hypothetical protein